MNSNITKNNTSISSLSFINLGKLYNIKLNVIKRYPNIKMYDINTLLKANEVFII
jgi:hypothetical protein